VSQLQQPENRPEDFSEDFYTSGNYIFYALSLRGQGREDDAKQVFVEANLRLNTYHSHFGLGVSLLNQQKSGEAIIEFQKAIQIKPDSVVALDALGRALDAAGRYDEAIDVFTKGLILNPNEHSIYICMGDVFKHKGDMQKAIQCYLDAAVGLTNKFPDGYICLANALLENGDIYESIDILTPLVDEYPNWAEIHLSMGNALSAAGRVDEAKQRWQRFLAIREEFIAEGLGSSDEDDEFAQQAEAKLRLPF
jgi:protein O-GlcNAc transferase